MNNKRWKCLHCGRNLGDRVPYRCKGTMRKNNLVFKDRLTDEIFSKDKKFGPEWLAKEKGLL